MKNITIIGAGLSGTLLAVNLLRQGSSEMVHIQLIDRRSKNDLGPAYSTDEDYLLNVPAEKMGAFPGDPEHFLKWAVKKKINAGRGDYLQRKLYREYIQSVLQESLDKKRDNTSFERIQGEAVDLKIYNGRAVVYLKDGSEIITDKVVLAPGNSPPLHPSVKSRSFINDKHYIQNPWDPLIFKNISPDDTVLFIGTGQTTIDLAAGLYRRKHRGELISISRRGLFPLVHKRVDPYPSFYDELRGHSDILTIFRIIRKHLRAAEEKGLDPRAVIDSLRPHTAAIWMQLPVPEKRKFLRHVFRYWEIIRSRIPPASMEIIDKMKSAGQLKAIAGRITDIIISGSKLKVIYNEWGREGGKSIQADWVINCIGPCQDYEKIEDVFIKNLLSAGLIECDPVHLGINATPDGSVISADGKPSGILYTIGLPLKGILWESLAAPEIRWQADRLARILINRAE
jgi:uncharacterized NAD(P)/FAD-binding protein YdhS